MRKIYDCVPFFNELEILEIRLELLYDHVDYFIISECDYTFSGLKKPFHFEENKERFSKYMDKIIHLKHHNTDKIEGIENTYTGKKKEIFTNILSKLNAVKGSVESDYGKPHWCRDYLHKEMTMLGMDVCEPDDIILFGDLDEIPNPVNFKIDGGKYYFTQKNMMYYINVENVTQIWGGTYMCKFSDILNNSCMSTRNERFTFNEIQDGGWHLSFMGGKERVKEKLKSYGHQEFNNNSILSAVDDKMNKNMDILNRNITIKNISVDDYYPDVLIKLINDKFKYLIKQ